MDPFTNLNITGVATFAGDVSIGGTLTYEDVTNIDSVGLVTARDGIFIPGTKKIEFGNTAEIHIFRYIIMVAILSLKKLQVVLKYMLVISI